MVTPRPLYRLPSLLADPSVPVVVVEGEKAADAAAWMLPGYAVTTWAGGCCAVKLADWSVLEGRNVVVIPDNDAPGYEAASFIASKISARKANIPPGLPEGWDVADAEACGMLPSDVLRMVRAAS